MTPRPRFAGFTLVELMIVVAIIGLLATISMPKFADFVRKSNEATTRASLGALRSALTIYSAANDGAKPGDHLECLTTDGRYLGKIPKCQLPPYHETVSLVSNSSEYPGAAIFTADAGHWLYANDPSIEGLGPREPGEVWVGCTHQDSRGIGWSSE
jgi:prepilin-type N-terminal cleavage/methylation domain-containing protein